MTIKNTPLTEEQIASAAKAYVAGETCKSIGLRLDRSESTISGLMKRRGLRRGNVPTRHEDPVFLALRRSGKSGPQIAKAMGVSTASVDWWINKATKAGLLPRTHRVPRSKTSPSTPRTDMWPQTAVDRLKTLWETMGPAEIARETGWGVAAIIGKARRMGLPRKGYPSNRMSAAGRTVSRRQTSAEAKAQVAEKREAAKQARAEEADTMWRPSATSRPFLDRGAHECSWPLGEGRSAHACCAPVEGRDTYCPHHRMLAGGGRTMGWAPAALGHRGGRALA